MSAMLAKILEEVNRLPPEEIRQLKASLEAIQSSARPADGEGRLEKRLVEAGLVAKRQLRPANAPRRKSRPILVEGKPVSELLVEERR